MTFAKITDGSSNTLLLAEKRLWLKRHDRAGQRLAVERHGEGKRHDAGAHRLPLLDACGHFLVADRVVAIGVEPLKRRAQADGAVQFVARDGAVAVRVVLIDARLGCIGRVDRRLLHRGRAIAARAECGQADNERQRPT